MGGRGRGEKGRREGERGERGRRTHGYMTLNDNYSSLIDLFTHISSCNATPGWLLA